MTYGWAILIIVIVAVILYSMGIFNPSSSITTTSIGFSPFTVSSTVCSQAGLSVAIIGGGIDRIAKELNLEREKFYSNEKFDPYSIIDIDTVLISERHMFRMQYSLRR